MSKKKTDLTSYDEDGLKFFVTNNNKFKLIFIESTDFDKVVLPMVEESFVYTQQQLEVLRNKWNKG